ncbi:MAG: hypothetical protein HOH05_07665 [Marinovum sp.]|nr:hypothetical protein [Marinovum sp.]
MTKCTSKCTLLAPYCSSFGWSIVLRRTIQNIENTPILIAIEAFKPHRKSSTTVQRPKQIHQSLALSP